MCIGIPMQVISLEGEFAWCEGMGQRKRVDTLLVPTPQVGSWLLVFMDSARELLDAEQAQRITLALQAVDLAMQGETNLDHLFADLEREPQLPAFLQGPTTNTKE